MTFRILTWRLYADRLYVDGLYVDRLYTDRIHGEVLCFPQEEDEDFVLLPYPPLYDPEASKQQEHQRVQVDFKTPEDEPDAHRFIIRKDQIGSLELLDSFKPNTEGQKARNLHRVARKLVHLSKRQPASLCCFEICMIFIM